MASLHGIVTAVLSRVANEGLHVVLAGAEAVIQSVIAAVKKYPVILDVCAGRVVIDDGCVGEAAGVGFERHHGSFGDCTLREKESVDYDVRGGERKGRIPG